MADGAKLIEPMGKIKLRVGQRLAILETIVLHGAMPAHALAAHIPELGTFCTAKEVHFRMLQWMRAYTMQNLQPPLELRDDGSWWLWML